MSDARSWAWMQAWDHLEAAQQLQEKYNGQDGLTEALNGVYRKAELYAMLAAVDSEVGAEAATILVQRQRQKKRTRDMLKDVLDDHDDTDGDAA